MDEGMDGEIERKNEQRRYKYRQRKCVRNIIFETKFLCVGEMEEEKEGRRESMRRENGENCGETEEKKKGKKVRMNKKE